MNRLTTSAWWYWLAMVVALAFTLAVDPRGLAIAVGLCLLQILHFGLREGSLTAFPLQVRIAYLMLLLLSLLPGGQFILWIQLIGTTAMVTVNYCLLARVLTLMPWNTDRPVGLKTVIDTLFAAPVAGSVQDRASVETTPAKPQA